MTTDFSLTARAAAAVILVVLAAGCAKSADSSAASSTPGSGTADGAHSADGATSTDSTSAASDASPSEADTTPAQEGTGAESPQPVKKESPTISVASLPIGGSADAGGAHQCGRVSLLLQQLPPGISISVSSIGLDPTGVFALGDDPCGSEPPCARWTWTTGTTDRACTVAATQVIDSADSVTLELTGTVTCPDQSTCDQVRNTLGGSQFQFTAIPGVVSGSSSDSSSSPAVSASVEPSTSTEASTAGS
jgi:hypothetical protein